MLNDIARLSEELTSEGFVVLKKCIDPDVILTVKNEFLTEYNNAVPLPWRGGGKWFGHVNYHPVPTNAVLCALTNSVDVKALVAHYLGSDYKITGTGGNANLPTSSFQPAHVDLMTPDYLIINVPLGAVDERNGSTEVWPGSHLRPMNLSEFAKHTRTPVRINTDVGDVVFRLPNLWHRGTPNKSPDVRGMLMIGVSNKYERLGFHPVEQGELSDLARLGMPVHYKVEHNARRGFRPNYFAPTTIGNARELLWKYCPRLYRRLQILLG